MYRIRNGIKSKVDLVIEILKKNSTFTLIFFIAFIVGVLVIPRIFAEEQPIGNVEIFSKEADYEKKEPGAWKVDKSAKWVAKGEAEITFDVDSVLDSYTDYTDLLLVLDTSGSMNDDKLNSLKNSTREMINKLLSTDKNKIGLITFNDDATLLSDFTSDHECLVSQINSISAKGSTNYYRALVKVNEALEKYEVRDGRKCVVLFLTDGYSNVDTPSEEFYYTYLKKKYPFVTINGIQYAMGTTVLQPLKKISDNQFIANINDVSEKLFKALLATAFFEKFEIVDYIDTDNFYITDENNINVDFGSFDFDRDNQKIVWNLNNLILGSTAQMKIKVKLKDELLEAGGVYSTNKEVVVKSKMNSLEEIVKSDASPLLTDNYKIIYDVNVPKGCIVKKIEDENASVLSVVSLTDELLECAGYDFKGWDIINDNVRMAGNNHFVMPESDVILRGSWGQTDISTSMSGEVYSYEPATLEKVTTHEEEVYIGCGEWEWQTFYDSTLHQYASSITKVVFLDELQEINGAIDILDVSEEKNRGILAYIVPNADDADMYTAYIEADGKVIANKNSFGLFANFFRLKSIEGFENVDTTGVTDMSYMFYNCSDLLTLDLSEKLDVSSVTDMKYMFNSCSLLTSLNLGNNFDTANVVNMSNMFSNCSSLINLDLGDMFDTSHVTGMRYMFSYCSDLRNIVLGEKFDTSKVIDMSEMFRLCSSLISLNLGDKFDTSNVTSMGSMFGWCHSLKTLDLGNKFNTSNITDMNNLFDECYSLTTLNLGPQFDTSKVTNMTGMFYECKKLEHLDLGKLFDTSSVTSMASMFYYCTSLFTLDLGDNFDTSKVTDMSWMFFNCEVLTSLDLGDKFDTSNVVNMEATFRWCKKLTILDLGDKFDTSSVRNMELLFSSCPALEVLNLGDKFDTSKVTDMRAMFAGLSSITSLDLSKFNTSNVENMEQLFSGMSKLGYLNLTGWNTSKVYNMSYMFSNTNFSIEQLNDIFKNLNTSNAIKMNGMFSMNSFDTFYLPTLDTSSVTDMSYMFGGCSNLVTINLENFDTSKVKNMYSMFRECSNIENLDLTDFDTSSVTNMSYMFYECRNLKAIDLTSCDTSNVEDMEAMFRECRALSELDLSHFDISKVTEMYGMFYNCENLSTTIMISYSLSSYSLMFSGAASNSGAKIIVNYTDKTIDIVDDIIATKGSKSNVVKGELVAV